MEHPPTASRARISEIFSSLQGEGPRYGERHIFVRFEECHMHCVYCDELGKPAEERTLEEVVSLIRDLEQKQGPHSFVSLTGGEPLLYLAFLKPLVIRLKEHAFNIYLETSGVLWKSLREVLPWCDCIAMDIKTPSVTQQINYHEEHRRFLAIARQRETFIKIVVSKEMDLRELRQEFELVSEVAPETPVVLMPISTDIEGHEDEALMKRMRSFKALGEDYLQDVRILPRFHKMLNIR